MTFRERFRRLTFWNKAGFIGSVASIIALLLALVWRVQDSGSPSLSSALDPYAQELSYVKQVEEIALRSTGIKGALVALLPRLAGAQTEVLEPERTFFREALSLTELAAALNLPHLVYADPHEAFEAALSAQETICGEVIKGGEARPVAEDFLARRLSDVDRQVTNSADAIVAIFAARHNSHREELLARGDAELARNNWREAVLVYEIAAEMPSAARPGSLEWVIAKTYGRLGDQGDDHLVERAEPDRELRIFRDIWLQYAAWERAYAWAVRADTAFAESANQYYRGQTALFLGSLHLFRLDQPQVAIEHFSRAVEAFQRTRPSKAATALYSLAAAQVLAAERASSDLARAQLCAEARGSLSRALSALPAAAKESRYELTRLFVTETIPRLTVDCSGSQLYAIPLVYADE